MWLDKTRQYNKTGTDETIRGDSDGTRRDKKINKKSRQDYARRRKKIWTRVDKTKT